MVFSLLRFCGIFIIEILLYFQNRDINHSSGSHGVPGIFVKYDLFAIKIAVREVHHPYSQFLIRLCGIIGGIFVVSGKYYMLRALYMYNCI